MRKKPSILTLALLGGVGVLLFLGMRGPREPQYEGKALSEWLEDLYENPPKEGVGNPAVDALQQMGTNAVPYLVHLLQAKDSQFKIDAAFLQRWTGLRFQWANEKRSAALRGIRILGPKARGALPALAQQLRGDSIAAGQRSQEVAYTMSEVGEEAIPVLEAALTNGNQFTRCGVIMALGRFTSRGDVVVPRLIPMLQRGSVLERGTVVDTLGGFPEHAEVIVPAIMPCLEDRNEMMRENAARALAYFGDKAKPAFPLLLKRAESGGDNERFTMAGALMEIDSKGTISYLLKDLRSRDRYVRKTVVHELMESKGSGPATVPTLVKYLKDKDVAVRLDAAVALQEIGEEPNLVVPALMENLKDPDAKVRIITAIALGAFGERSKVAVPKILKIMEESKADELGKSKLLQALLLQAVHNINPAAAAERFFLKEEK